MCVEKYVFVYQCASMRNRFERRISAHSSAASFNCCAYPTSVCLASACQNACFLSEPFLMGEVPL